MSEIKYYTVGGYVRDSLLGVKSHDIDFAVEAPSYEAMRQDLIAKGVRIFLETPIYFTIRGSHPEYGGVDYVLCRKDGDYVDGRHPEQVLAGTLYDDLARRDFTINAMAFNESGQIIDPFDGQVDLKIGQIKCVGDPHKRFEEDALRILRAIRFATRLGFDIEVNTQIAMAAWADTVRRLPLERVREELHKCFKQNTLKTIFYLIRFNLMTDIFGQDSSLWLMPTNKQ
jgi:tRNA nucleotidyltransferase (CCA-adding enzyme)